MYMLKYTKSWEQWKKHIIAFDPIVHKILYHENSI